MCCPHRPGVGVKMHMASVKNTIFALFSKTRISRPYRPSALELSRIAPKWFSYAEPVPHLYALNSSLEKLTKCGGKHQTYYRKTEEKWGELHYQTKS